jgi:hypothetical protein
MDRPRQASDGRLLELATCAANDEAIDKRGVLEWLRHLRRTLAACRLHPNLAARAFDASMPRTDTEFQGIPRTCDDLGWCWLWVQADAPHGGAPRALRGVNAARAGRMPAVPGFWAFAGQRGLSAGFFRLFFQLLLLILAVLSFALGVIPVSVWGARLRLENLILAPGAWV